MAPEIIPVITGVIAGGGIGLYYERRAQEMAAQEQQPIAESLAKTARVAQESAPAAPGAARRWLGRKALAVVAFPAMAAGGFAGLAYEQSSANDTMPPTLEIVVDHSGATALPPDNQPKGQPIVGEINKVVAQFRQVGSIKPEVLVSGHNEDAIKMPLTEVQTDRPYGQSHMDQATQTALSRTGNILPLSDGHHMSRNAALFVITNGDDIGVPAEIVQESKDQGKTPIYVVNVEGDSSAATAKNLQQIASQTGGKYWDVKQASLDNAAVSVKKTITSYSRPNNNLELAGLYGGVAALFLAGTRVAYRLRKRMPINKGFDRNLGR